MLDPAFGEKIVVPRRRLELPKVYTALPSGFPVRLRPVGPPQNGTEGFTRPTSRGSIRTSAKSLRSQTAALRSRTCRIASHDEYTSTPGRLAPSISTLVPRGRLPESQP